MCSTICYRKVIDPTIHHSLHHENDSHVVASVAVVSEELLDCFQPRVHPVSSRFHPGQVLRLPSAVHIRQAFPSYLKAKKLELGHGTFLP